MEEIDAVESQINRINTQTNRFTYAKERLEIVKSKLYELQNQETTNIVNHGNLEI
jgi:hypothetical protein